MKASFLILVILALFAVATFYQNEASATAAPEILLEDLVFTAVDLRQENATGMSLLPQGIRPQSADGTYTSQVIETPFPFNALVPAWTAELPEYAMLELEVRTGPSATELGEWIHVHPSMDWTLPEDGDTVGEMLVVNAEDTKHSFVQYRLSLLRGEAVNAPVLRELRLTLIDSTAGPTVEEMVVAQEQLDKHGAQNQPFAVEANQDNPKPFVISREVWCTSPACDYTDGLTYQPVTHLILHHTVSGTGSDGDSAAVVRAIWAYHTSGRGWRDIGYNFLVDTKGVLFEGHLGGDDVVGIHASGANAGSMALAMIGTYSTTEPPDQMHKSIVDLFSWKAEQRGIDVFDASNTLPNIDWGLPNLMGHRDVYGTTECPGGVAHALIPAIRDEVAARIGLESPHIYVDELSSAFRKSNANWYVGPLQCGNNAHSWYTWSTTDPGQAANWGEWRPEIPENGRYEIEVYAPYCNTGRSETTGAPYTVTHAGGTTEVIVNQDDRIGLWTSIGQYQLRAGNENVIRLGDLTQTDNGRGIWFDAIRLLPLESFPEVTVTMPADGSWSREREVQFRWEIVNPERVQSTVLQVATDEQFQNRIVNEIWPTPIYGSSVQFMQDYRALYWRVVVASDSGSEYPSAISQFGIDTEAPTSQVTRIYWLQPDGLYRVFWEGTDALTGIGLYNIDVRPAAASNEAWTPWLREVSATSSLFSPPDSAEVYEFRSQAIDRLGNTEEPHQTADISTEQATSLDFGFYLPLTLR